MLRPHPEGPRTTPALNYVVGTAPPRGKLTPPVRGRRAAASGFGWVRGDSGKGLGLHPVLTLFGAGHSGQAALPFFLEGGNCGDLSVVSGKEDAVPLRWAGRCGGDWPRCGVHVCDCAHARSRGVSPMPLCQGTSRNQQEGEPGSSRQDQAGRRLPGHCPQPPGRLSGVGLGGGAEARSSGRPAGADRLLPLPACSFSGHSGPAPQAPPLAWLCLPANLCRAGPRRGPCAVSPFPKSHGTPQRARKQGLPRGCSPLSPPNTGSRGKPALRLASAGALWTDRRPTSLQLWERVRARAQGPGDVLARPLPWVEW